MVREGVKSGDGKLLRERDLGRPVVVMKPPSSLDADSLRGDGSSRMALVLWGKRCEPQDATLFKPSISLGLFATVNT